VTDQTIARHLAPSVVVVLVVGVLMAGTLTSSARGHAQPARSAGDDPRAVSLLHRAISAPDQVSYAGTQYVSTWSALDRSVSTSAVVDVRHTAGGPTVVTRHSAGRTSVPVWYDGEVWLGGSGGPVGLLVKAYEVRLAGRSQVAGRPAEVVSAHRSDGSRAARLWLDAEYSLPLRREVYDGAGRTVSASAFVEIEVVPSLRSRFASSLSTGSGERTGRPETTALSHAELADLRADGWTCPTALEGGLILYQANRHAEAIQLSYSDGVATVSVFEQTGRLDPSTLDGFTERETGEGVVYAMAGPPSQFVWSTTDGRVITVVADGSLDSVDAVIAAFPPAAAQDSAGLLDRIGRGAKRLLSWLNPFG
jgi:hypothetical protein